jgi:DNA polymerase-3 subunit gamma/tau
VKYAPSRGKYKIYIIDEFHMLTKESFNAFLKTLEEPPSHTIFILATTEMQKVPLTIMSRCQRFDFRRIPLDTIKSLLSEIARSEKIEIDDKTLTIIAKKADGALRDAESFFDQIVSYCGDKIDTVTVSKMLNIIDDEIYFNISDAVLTRDFNEVFRVTGYIYDNGYDFIEFINGLIGHFRNILTVILTKNTNQVETAEVYKSKYFGYIDKYTEGDLLRILNFLNKSQQELRFTQNHRLKVEISLSQLIGFERTATITELLGRIGMGGSDTPRNILREPEKKNYSSPKVITPGNETVINKTFTPSVLNEPETKEPLKVTLLKVKEIPVKDTGDFNLESIRTKWDKFVSLVMDEKRFSLGPYIGNLELSALEGNKLKVYLEDEQGRKSFGFDKDYLGKKTAEIFGKKIIFQFEDQPRNSTGYNERKHIPITSGEKGPNDPLVDLIIKEFGGQEISG